MPASMICLQYVWYHLLSKKLKDLVMKKDLSAKACTNADVGTLSVVLESVLLQMGLVSNF